MFSTPQDIHFRTISALATAAACILVAQAASEPAVRNNETGIFACAIVFFGYLVHTIGCLERIKFMAAFGMNMAMCAHGFQLAYYYYRPLAVGLMLPPLMLAALFIAYAVAHECGVFDLRTVTRSTETNDECEDESKDDEFRDVELV